MTNRVEVIPKLPGPPADECHALIGKGEVRRQLINRYQYIGDVPHATAYAVAADFTGLKSLEFQRQLSMIKYFLRALTGRGFFRNHVGCLNVL